MTLRLVMMGTGLFALPTLTRLYQLEHQVVGLFTQPDRTGRGHHQHVNPMKTIALEHETPVYGPQDVNSPEGLDNLRSLEADLCVVAAYGQILSDTLLEIPRLGAINIHASLLPKYRGAAPIQYAILNGETETGVTIFQIEPKLDAGPILAVERTTIGSKETSGELEVRLADISAGLIGKVVDQIETGSAQQATQDVELVTRAPRIRKSFGLIDWTKSALEIGWHVRAMQPWPTAYTFFERTGTRPLRLIVLDVEPADETANSVEPGSIVSTEGNQIIVQTGQGCLAIERVRPEGKREMTAAEFLRGHAVQPGSRLLPNPEAG